MTADLLRRAAAKIRETAQGATPGPWRVEDMDQTRYSANPVNSPSDGWWWVWQDTASPYYQGVAEMESHDPDCNQAICTATRADASGERQQEQKDAAHIALWSPLTAELVAQWLDAAARRDEQKPRPGAPHDVQAHRLALFILGEDS